MASQTKTSIAGLLALVASTCTPREPGTNHPAVTQATPVPPAATVSALSAIPTAAASASSAKPPEAPPVLALPAGVAPEQFAMLASVCAVGVYRSEGKVQSFGCRSVPPYDTPEKRPDGAVAEVPTSDDLCSPGVIYKGSFTRAGARQAVIYLTPCTDGEPPMAASYGHAVVVEEQGGVWGFVAHQTDLWMGECTDRSFDECAIGCRTMHKEDGHDVLYCKDSFGAPPDGGNKTVYSLDFAQPKGSWKTHIAAFFFNDFDLSCGGPGYDPTSQPGFLGPGIARAAVRGFTFADLDKDGNLDLEIVVRRAYVPHSAGLLAKVKARCKGHPTVDPGAFLPRPADTKLVFKAGQLPTAATIAVLDAWAAVSPSHWVRPR